MFLRHARLMPRLSGYRVSSMSARARPDAFFFFLSEEEWQAQQANKQKEQESSSPCMMVAVVGYLFWFGPHRTASSRTWLQQRTPPSSILRRPSVSSALQRNASTLLPLRKHSHSQARCPVAAEVDGFCACVPDSRPPCVFIHGNNARPRAPGLCLALFVGG